MTTKPGTPLDSGDVVLIPYPHTDLGRGKQRPALVLTRAAYHADSPDALVAYVTSRPQTGPWSLKLTNHDLSSGALVKDSWVRIDRIATLDQRLIKKVVARIRKDHLETIRSRIKRLLC